MHFSVDNHWLQNLLAGWCGSSTSLSWGTSQSGWPRQNRYTTMRSRGCSSSSIFSFFSSEQQSYVSVIVSSTCLIIENPHHSCKVLVYVIAIMQIKLFSLNQEIYEFCYCYDLCKFQKNCDFGTFLMHFGLMLCSPVVTASFGRCWCFVDLMILHVKMQQGRCWELDNARYMGSCCCELPVRTEGNSHATKCYLLCIPLHNCSITVNHD